MFGAEHKKAGNISTEQRPWKKIEAYKGDKMVDEQSSEGCLYLVMKVHHQIMCVVEKFPYIKLPGHAIAFP